MDDEPVEFFYIWKENEKTFEIFQLLIPYWKGEQKEIDTVLLVALVQEWNQELEEKISLREISRKLPYIREGYLTTLFPAPEPETKQET